MFLVTAQRDGLSGDRHRIAQADGGARIDSDDDASAHLLAACRRHGRRLAPAGRDGHPVVRQRHRHGPAAGPADGAAAQLHDHPTSSGRKLLRLTTRIINTGRATCVMARRTSTSQRTMTVRQRIYDLAGGAH